MALSLKKETEKELLLNLYIRLSNEFGIMLQKFEYSSGMYTLNLCKVIDENLELSYVEKSLLIDDMREHRTQWIGLHWFRDIEDRKKFLENRISELRRELSVKTYDSKVEKNKKVIRYNLKREI